LFFFLVGVLVTEASWRVAALAAESPDLDAGPEVLVEVEVTVTVGLGRGLAVGPGFGFAVGLGFDVEEAGCT
jgi:hypothetical protein